MPRVSFFQAVSSHIFNTFSILAALAGGILLGIDLFTISILNMRQLSIPLLEKIGLPSSYFLAVRCEDGLIPLDYCRALRSYETVCVQIPTQCCELWFRTDDV